MRDSSLDKLTVKELKELRLKVDYAISTRHNDERNALREQFRALAEQAGFTLTEVVGGGGRGSKGRSASAKFANPVDPEETWSGRGRQPRWLSAKLRSGASLDDFRL